MKIKTTMRLSATFSISLILFLGLVVWFSNGKVVASREKIVFVENVLENVFELNTLTIDYVREKSKSSEFQWESMHNTITENIGSKEFINPEQKIIVANFARNIKIARDLFLQLGKPDNKEHDVGLTNQLVFRLQTIVSNAFSLKNIIRTELDRSQKQFGLLLTISLILLAIVSILSSILMSNSVGKPITRLTSVIDDISKGKLNAKIDEQNLVLEDEIGQLSRAFDEMTRNLTLTTVSRDDFEAANLQLTAAEQELRKNQELLVGLNKELEQKNQELAQVVYVASHDLRSPLVNVQGFSKELGYTIKELTGILKSEGMPPDIREKATRLLDGDVQDSLKYIMTAIARMDMLLSGLQKLSRVGRAAMNIEKLDMNKTVSTVVDTIEFQIKETGTTIEMGNLPPCRGDGMQIGQVFANLIGNALKYRDPARAGKVSISGEQRDNQVIYRVEDNGIGIAPEHQKIVFEIFHRLNPATGEGEGLGLTIVRTILDRHNGKVWLESEPGKGSSFFVSLPCA